MVTAIYQHKEQRRYKAHPLTLLNLMGFFFYTSDTTSRLHRWVLIQNQSAFPDDFFFSPFQFQLSRCLSPSPIRRRATSHLKPPMLFHVSSSVSSGVRLSPPLRTLWQWDAILFISTRSRLFPTDSPRCRFCCIHAVHFSCLGAQVFVGCIYFLHAPSRLLYALCATFVRGRALTIYMYMEAKRSRKWDGFMTGNSS